MEPKKDEWMRQVCLLVDYDCDVLRFDKIICEAKSDANNTFLLPVGSHYLYLIDKQTKEEQKVFVKVEQGQNDLVIEARKNKLEDNKFQDADIHKKDSISEKEEYPSNIGDKMSELTKTGTKETVTMDETDKRRNQTSTQKEQIKKKKYFQILLPAILLIVIAICCLWGNLSASEEEDYVDLGLSVKWANRNIGANTPYECGNFYSWGEVNEKDTYNWQNYKYYREFESYATKYCQSDGLTSIINQDDAAVINWNNGSLYRMPTLKEINELINLCEWKWTIKENQEGMLVTGPSGNSIFLPAGSYRDSTGLHDKVGCYWTSDRYSDEYNAYDLFFDKNGIKSIIAARFLGFNIRPVK